MVGFGTQHRALSAEIGLKFKPTHDLRNLS